MKTIKFIFATTGLLFLTLICKSQPIGNERTLFVDFFGQTIFSVDEDGITPIVYEREVDLINYCTAKKITTIILKRLDEIEDPGTSAKIFPHLAPTISVGGPNLPTYLRLADFLEKCRQTPSTITHIAAADYPFANNSGSYTNNKFWDNIAIFNIYMNANGHPNAYFDVIYGEQDYWGGDPVPNNKTNYSTWYLPGLSYMKSIKNETSSPSYPANKILYTATYVGDFDVLNTITPVSDQVDWQTQADDIDQRVDLVYLAFYFQGFRIDNPPVHTGTQNPQAFFKTDLGLGKRLYCFANNNYPSNPAPNNKTKIILLYGGAASNDVNHNYFGDYMDYEHSGYYTNTTPTPQLNLNFDFVQSFLNWHDIFYPVGTTQDPFVTQFENYYTTDPDPYCDGTGNLLGVPQTMKQITETNPAAVGGNGHPNSMEGVGWFKYSTMADARYFLKVSKYEEIPNLPNPPIIVYTGENVNGEIVNATASMYLTADELFGTGTDNCVACKDFNTAVNRTTTINNRTWYYRGQSTSTNQPFQVTHITGDDYVTCEIDVTAYKNGGTQVDAGSFKNAKLRRTIKLSSPSIPVGINGGGNTGSGNHPITITDYTYPTCPNYHNGSVSVACYYNAFYHTANDFSYKFYRNGSSTVYAVANCQNNFTVNNLEDGTYTIKLFSCACSFGTYSEYGATYPADEYTLQLYRANPSFNPQIFPTYLSKGNCNGDLSTTYYPGFTYQWKRNGVSILGATTSHYIATLNGDYTVTAKSPDLCEVTSSPYQLDITMTPSIIGSNITCEANKTYKVPEGPNYTSYSWTVTPGATFTQDANEITVTWNSLETLGGMITCTVTNSCGNTASTSIQVKGCCTSASIWDMNNYSITSGTPSLTGTFNINGILNISGVGTVVTMNGADVKLNKEAKIVVEAGAKLIITGNSYLRSCGTDMWTGIELLGNAIVELNSKSKIEDAIVAIDAPQNGKVVINDATLNANYRGLRITGTGAANSSYIGSQSIFSCKNGSNVNSNCLKSPYTAQRSFEAISLTNIGSIDIGDASNTANDISNFDRGIYTTTSTVNVVKTNFSNCSKGIYAFSDGNLSASSCNFNECTTGIEDKYNVNLNVSSSNFNSGKKGIYTSLGNTITIQINDNNFTDITAFAIQHISNHRCQYAIYTNIISSTGSEAMFYPGGIEINGLYDNSVDNSSVTNIYSNEFYDLAKGIHLQSIDDAHIYSNLHNELMETGSYDYQTYGIKIENCENTTIEVNSVSSYGASQQQIWWSNGIMADNSPYTNILCNSVGNIGRGLWIGGASPHTTLAGNAMGDCYDQLYLNWNLMGLQDQGANTTSNPPNGLALDNEWVGSPYSAGNGHQTTSRYSNYFKGGGYTTFHTRSGGTYEPTDNYTYDVNNDYQACTTDILYNFSAESYCSERPELPNNHEYESRVAQDSINYDSYYETFKWMGKEYLLGRTKQDATLAANDADIASAVVQLEQDNVGTIDALKDSIIIVDVDSASALEIAPLQQINNGLQPALAVESNYKTATNLSLLFAQNKSFTNGQKSTIIYLSNLCPYSAGPAVYMARTLRALFEDESPRYNACDNFNPIPQNRKANLIQDGGMNSSFKLFPSPSDGNSVYEFVFDKKATANLKVYDYTGKLILQKDVSGTNRYEFKKLNLSEGVYRVQLFVNGELGDEQNMVVVK